MRERLSRPQHKKFELFKPVPAALRRALAEAMQPTHVSQWLNQPNEMLNNLKPAEAIKRGQLDLVLQVVEGLRSGSPL